jgi:hypothetical protein
MGKGRVGKTYLQGTKTSLQEEPSRPVSLVENYTQLYKAARVRVGVRDRVRIRVRVGVKVREAGWGYTKGQQEVKQRLVVRER